jgi:hypothetical protein
MRSSSMTAYGTAGMWTIARVNCVSMACPTPPRANVTFTFEPGVPVRRLDTPSSFSPFVLVPFTDTMRSPS